MRSYVRDTRSRKSKSDRPMSFHPSSSVTAVPQYIILYDGDKTNATSSTSSVSSRSAQRLRLGNSNAGGDLTPRGCDGTGCWEVAVDMVAHRKAFTCKVKSNEDLPL